MEWKKVLEGVIVIAKQQIEIGEKYFRIIKHWKKSLLNHKDEAWKKKESDSCFDVTMGSNNGAKVCQLTEIYTSSQLSNVVPRKDSSLYWDDGLILLRNKNRQLRDRIRKKM